MMIQNVFFLAAVLIGASASFVQAQWQSKNGPLMTRWAADVSPDNVHAKYPRPQMVREHWQSLNGLWDYAIRPKAAGRPDQFDGQILVPFPVESALSGVMKRVGENQRLWYRRTFTRPPLWGNGNVLLHFGAVDWEALVWVNGKKVGEHRGGYDPFTFDITDALHESGEQEIVLAVWDPTDAGTQPRGKQVRQPKGIWYTPSTGIWQTVWLEPAGRIKGLKLTSDVDRSRLLVTLVDTPVSRSEAVDVVVLEDGQEVARGIGSSDIVVEIPSPKLWSPDRPFLYELRVTLRWYKDPQRVHDQVTSYFGMRKISLGKDNHGVTRIMLNNQPLFMYGLLDQGFWPDGLYTAPTDAALRYDVEMTKRLGFNLARKHVKVEPARWYYWCDQLGLLVWQDMPNPSLKPLIQAPSASAGSSSAGPPSPAPVSPAQQFELELKRLIDAHYNHPSIVMWVPFNEGWGQYDTRRIVEWIKDYDPTRLVNCASGWHDRSVGDVHDIHAYPGPASPQPEPNRAAVLGEFGGLGLPVAEHTWQPEKSWGYRSFKTAGELTEAYLNLLNMLRPMISDPGLSAAVYTQTTDVEIEVNGLMTYDRAILKMDADRIATANRRLYLPPLVIKTVVPTSQNRGVPWHYTTIAPAGDWYQPGFDDSSWKQEVGGFGREGTPGAVVRTDWHSPDIWLRRHFDHSSVKLVNPHLKLYHDEDCEVYINGRLIASVKGYTTSYVLVPLTDRSVLQPGRNVLAVHCRQTTGGQGIDVGVVDVLDQ